MSIKPGDKELKSLCIGDKKVSAVYVGDQKVRPMGASDIREFEIECLGGQYRSADYDICIGTDLSYNNKDSMNNKNIIQVRVRNNRVLDSYARTAGGFQKNSHPGYIEPKIRLKIDLKEKKVTLTNISRDGTEREMGTSSSLIPDIFLDQKLYLNIQAKINSRGSCFLLIGSVRIKKNGEQILYKQFRDQTIEPFVILKGPQFKNYSTQLALGQIGFNGYDANNDKGQVYYAMK